MELCHGRPIPHNDVDNPIILEDPVLGANSEPTKTSNFPFYGPSPLPSGFKNSPANSSVSSTPCGHGFVKPNEATILEGSECEVGLDKNFRYSKQVLTKYELGEEVGRGHFGYTCSAKGKERELKGQEVAVKVISKAKMTKATDIKDVRREVKILHALIGHKNLVQFYDACEDDDNVYILIDSNIIPRRKGVNVGNDQKEDDW
ncbi:hypothetical protein NE237_013087 [Protea cynaroides]|uniref:Protein kinase domain-containing protein n=1 Tax=Protea cynaroides TaxID=273540 RepID=A0A9Q0H364_9MAGN|nr:hypothetical protein NE237_013087 [Protea cynaroides]